MIDDYVPIPGDDYRRRKQAHFGDANAWDHPGNAPHDRGRTLFTHVHSRRIEKHRATLRDKSGLAYTDFDTLLDRIFASIEILSKNRTTRHHKRAEQAMDGIDIKVAIYVAAALELDGAIWSYGLDLREHIGELPLDPRKSAIGRPNCSRSPA